MKTITKKILSCALSTACIISAVPFTVSADDGGGVLDWLSGVADDVSDMAEGAVDDAKNWAEGAADDAADWAEGAVDDATNWAEGAIDDAAGDIINAAVDAADWAMGAYVEAKDWTIQAFNDAKDWTTGAIGDTSAFIDEVCLSEETDPEKLLNTEYESEDGQLIYFLGQSVNAGLDTGYSEADTITINDPHYGWNIGTFAVGGFTRVITDDPENPVFLKTVGDEVSLWFRLYQYIDYLNGKESLSIADDTNGYDEYFGIPKTDFGRGTLIVRYTDYQNNKSDPVIYTDFLAGVEAGANTGIALFEEGDYEIALDYETAESTLDLGGKILPSFNDYKIFFRFSVRNGNCMVFPFDIVTGSELTNCSVTENGFYLDLAQSRYLDVNVKKEVLNDTADGLVEDTRFNRPAQDGDEYTSEGIYTITAYNKYTGEETEKKIYVGTDEVLYCAAVTGLSVQQIKDEVANGAVITEDGHLGVEE